MRNILVVHQEDDVSSFAVVYWEGNEKYFSVRLKAAVTEWANCTPDGAEAWEKFPNFNVGDLANYTGCVSFQEILTRFSIKNLKIETFFSSDVGWKYDDVLVNK